MNMMVLVLSIGVVLFVFQAIFFASCAKWLSGQKKKKEQDFKILDKERAKLIELQSQLKAEVLEAKKLSEDNLKKLKILGSEVHAEWDDITKKINDVLIEIDHHSSTMLESNISKLNLQKMSIDKSVQNAYKIEESLGTVVKKAQRILKLFDAVLPTEDVLKELQSNKYMDAKKMLHDGLDASVISKKLGLSMGEVVTLSSLSKM